MKVAPGRRTHFAVCLLRAWLGQWIEKEFLNVAADQFRFRTLQQSLSGGIDQRNVAFHPRGDQSSAYP